MRRLVTLYTAQWTDLPLEAVCNKARDWGYDGLELACWGGHFDIDTALTDEGYCRRTRECLADYGLVPCALGTHPIGHLVCSPDDAVAADVASHLAGLPEAQQAWATEQMQRAALAAARLGVATVVGFVGSPVWHLWYPFPPVSVDQIAAGYQAVAARWEAILVVFERAGVRFALEVHPSQIAYDTVTAATTLTAVGHHGTFGLNLDPSHLHWQGIDAAAFARRFGPHIFHVHAKDVVVTRDGLCGILGSHLPLGDSRRGWNFRTPGRGDVDFTALLAALDAVQYAGPLSVEWEDYGQDREAGARAACAHLRALAAEAGPEQS